MLGNHDNTRGPGCAPDARNGEELDKAGEHVVGDLEAGLFDEKHLLIQKALDVIEISGGLDGGVSKSQERFPGLFVLSLLHIPSRTFGAKVCTNDQGDGGNECRTKLKAPSDIADFTNSQVGTCSQEDTKCRPHLPRHDKTTSNSRGCILSAEDGDCNFFQTHTDTEEHTSDGYEQLANNNRPTSFYVPTSRKLSPGLGDGHTKRSEKREDGADENGTSTADPMVKGVGNPSSARDSLTIYPLTSHHGQRTISRL